MRALLESITEELKNSSSLFAAVMGIQQSDHSVFATKKHHCISGYGSVLYHSVMKQFLNLKCIC